MKSRPKDGVQDILSLINSTFFDKDTLLNMPFQKVCPSVNPNIINEEQYNIKWKMTDLK